MKISLPETLLWALRDMRGSWRHFRLVFLCLFLSLASVTAIQIAGSSVLKSIEAQGNIILGGDWVLRQLYQAVGSEERSWITARGGEITDTTEMRVMLINPETEDAGLIELKSVGAGYPVYGEIRTNPAGDFHQYLQEGLVLDPNLGERLNVQLGDIVQLGEKNFKIAAWVEKEPDRAGGSRFGLAPRVFIAGQELSATQLLQPGSMTYHDMRVKWPATQNLRELKKEFNTAFPEAAWRLSDKERASPQIQRYVDNVVQFLTLIALSSLLIGGIGIANGMRAYFQTRMTTIAIFKATGMAQAQIRKIYLWQIFGIGLAGTVLGLMTGIALPYIALPFLQPMMPFDVEISLGLKEIAVPLSFGLLTSFIFSLWPLGEAEKTSPLLLLRNMSVLEGQRPGLHIILSLIPLIAAMGFIIIFSSENRVFSFAFLIGASFCFAFFFLLGKSISSFAIRHAGRYSFVVRLALQNLGRKGNSTSQTLVSLGIGLTVLISIALIERNLSATLHDNLPDDAPAFFFLDIQPEQKDRFSEIVTSIPGASKLIVMPNLRGRIVSVNGVAAKDALIDKRESWLLANERGFTYTGEQPAHSEITSGKWWPANYSGPPLISVVDDVERGFGVTPGDKMVVSVLGREIEATIANIREVNWTNFTVNFAITFAPGVLEAAPHSWLATVVAPPARESQIQRAVTRDFPNISMIRISEAIETVTNLLGQMNQAIRIMALLALTTGLIVLAESLIATRARRSYDTVILKVVGVPQSILRNTLLIEFTLLGFIASASAAFIATIVSWAVLSLWMDLSWSFYPELIITTIIVSLLTILVTSWLVLRNLLQASPRPYLRND